MNRDGFPDHRGHISIHRQISVKNDCRVSADRPILKIVVKKKKKTVNRSFQVLKLAISHIARRAVAPKRDSYPHF